MYLNGRLVQRRDVPIRKGEPTDVRLRIPLELPRHDAYLVCAVLGEGVAAPFWRTQEPYTLGATNPILLDVDGDRRYASPRALAARLLARTGTGSKAVAAALREVDDTVAVQVAALLHARLARRGPERARARLRELVERSGGRAALVEYEKSLSARSEK